MKYKPPPRFNEGFLVADGKGHKSLVGRLLPQPPMHTAAGQDVLLDEALGSRFVLLRSARPAGDFARLRQPVWDKLGVARVALLPAGSPAPVVEGSKQSPRRTTRWRPPWRTTGAAPSCCGLITTLQRPFRWTTPIAQAKRWTTCSRQPGSRPTQPMNPNSPGPGPSAQKLNAA